ncbi:MAG: AsnC family transcriptional regulator, partial [Nitrosopumilus sp.]|nr:AsnC family transcriptional regulator [Nitrosopumilus sp.]
MYRDKIDEKIIGYLKEDSRGSFVDIGKKLKLSESAVRRRVKNLIENGTIKKFTLELGEENA